MTHALDSPVVPQLTTDNRCFIAIRQMHRLVFLSKGWMSLDPHGAAHYNRNGNEISLDQNQTLN